MSLYISLYQIFTVAILQDYSHDKIRTKIVYYILFFRSKTFFPPEAVGKAIDFLPQCEMCDLYNMSNDYKANKMTSFCLNFRVRRANSRMCHI